jgi:hypothetical protein
MVWIGVDAQNGPWLIYVRLRARPTLVCHVRYRRCAASAAAVLRKAEVKAQELLAAPYCMAVGAFLEAGPDLRAEASSG